MRIRYSFGSRHTGHIENIKKQRGKYPDVMKEVIQISDIILEILDARFANEMRNKSVEESIRQKGAKIIYILNKSDLVNKNEIEKTLPKDMRPYVFVSAKTGEGAKELRNRIKIEAKRVELPDKKERVQVGIIGYPNAGKSSLINLITRKGAAKTSRQAGFTRGMQKIRFAEGILMLDTPGVIPDDKYSTDEKNNRTKDTKVGARTYSDIKDPEDVVYHLMSPPTAKDEENPTVEEVKAIKEAEINSKKIEKFYNIDAHGDAETLIEELGKKKKFLKKGGKTDIDRTARLIIRDWQNGVIK